MAALTNGTVNGYTSEPNMAAGAKFSDVPKAIDIPVSGMDIDEAVEVDLEELLDDPTELCQLLENEGAAKQYWVTISLAYAKQKKVDHALDVLSKGLESLSRTDPKETLGPLTLLCWFYLGKSRDAPRTVSDKQLVTEVKTKDFYLQAATSALNDASRINPSFPPLFVARGVLYLLRASLQPPARTADRSERIETLRQAVKCFEDALRMSSGKNLMAMLGRARTSFSLGKFADALEAYQQVLAMAPKMFTPDPRIGVGCCLWQLGHKEEAREAWERALELSPDSKVANILLGLFYTYESSHYSTDDPAFGSIYKKAMTVYTQKSFKLDKEYPLTCATFGNFFLLRKVWSTVETLARKAIEQTDVNAIASDGWYLLARREHYQEPADLSRANDYYGRADAARGGGDKGFAPARVGMSQIQIQLKDLAGAKFRLEKAIQQSKSVEAMTLLGALNADEVFANMSRGTKEDKSVEVKRATALLESVRAAWKTDQAKVQTDPSVLIYLARLYEIDQPEKSLQYLQQVEQIALEDLPNKSPPEGEDVDPDFQAKLREQLNPQLLNNIGCFQFQLEKFDAAREVFQIALNACVNAGKRDESLDTDALVTTISFNLARTYEADGMLDSAKQVYEQLLERHEDYTDARARLAYIDLRQNPSGDGPKTMASLYETDSMNLEVRSLFGWYLNRAKKRTTNIAEDQEQRHYKHTLQHHDKHDRYALTGMGNLYLTTAREMRRGTDSERQKRSKMYEKAVEFYDKALQLDPQNAYAAQGIAIAIIEDKKELSSGLSIFSKIKNTLRDSSVCVNLGHAFADLKQFSRSIESYEATLSKDRASDPQVLACLGRVWLLKGKQDKSAQAMRNALDYSQRALSVAPGQVHFQFNIAFVQFSLAQLIYTLPPSQRTLQEVQSASEALDSAIESFAAIAQAKNPPYPKHDIEQRANMGRNTMRRQLERAVQSQREYEEQNAEKLQKARLAREEEMRAREAERKAAEEAAAEQKRKIAEERHKMLELSRELAEKRAEEERRKEEMEYTTDSETGERVKRKKKTKAAATKRKKKNADDSEPEPGSTDGEPAPRKKKASRRDRDTEEDPSSTEPTKKKRRLARKSGGKASRADDYYKSAERIVDSDDDDEADIAAPAARPSVGEEESSPPTVAGSPAPIALDGDEQDPDTLMGGGDDEDEDEDEDAVATAPSRKRAERRVAEDDDDEEEEEEEDEDEGARNEEGLGGRDGVAGNGDDRGALAGMAASALNGMDDEDEDMVDS